MGARTPGPRRFQALLIALILLLLCYPAVQGPFGGQLLAHALLTVVFVAAFVVIFTERRLRLAALLLGVPTLAGAWTHYALEGLPRAPVSVCFHALAALFFAFTLATILWTVLQEKTVTSESIYGALCAYLLAGVGFGHLYCLVEAAAPGSFRGSEEMMARLADERHQRFLLTYFSFITLTTLGYGDITPAGGAARGLAVVEAVTGQLYVAVLIAELVGKKVAQAVSERRPESGG